MKGRGVQKKRSAALALFVLPGIWGTMCSAASKGAPCNIVLITIDTLRADHLSCYGYYRKTSPNIDRLAKKGIVCRNVYAPSSWTVPSMASLFTSVYPINHGVIHGIGYQQNKTRYTQEIFSPDLTTLAEALQEQGYTTFGVASNSHLSEKFGFTRGFDYFTSLPFLPAPAVNAAVYAWEDTIKKAGKYFLWIHYFDPHAPYTAQQPWINDYALQAHTEVLLDLHNRSAAELANLLLDFQKGELAAEMVPLRSGIEKLMRDFKDTTISPEDHSLALYDSEISYVDSTIGTLMERFNFSDDTLIIITSDHGEEFLEHGETGHGRNLYQQTIHVPLIVKMPHGQEGMILNQPISLIDVMPTILDISKVNPPAAMLGRSFREEKKLSLWLKKMMAGEDTDYGYSELDTKRSLKAILSPPWKYIYNCKDKTGQLFDIESDPLETHDLAGEKTGKRDQLRDHLLRWAETSKRYPTTQYDVEIPAEIKEQLKGLGYLE